MFGTVLRDKSLIMEEITREEAAARGWKRYFTGQPCKRGHLAPRYVSTGACFQCLNRYSPALRPLETGAMAWNVSIRTPRLPGAAQYLELEQYLGECVKVWAEAKGYKPEP